MNHVDSHFHCWQLSRGDYGWLTPALAPIYRDVAVADWEAFAQPLGISGGVLVQAAPTVAETRFMLRQAQEHDSVLGVVGWADLLAADAADQIATLATNPKLKGLRPMLQDIADADWILQRALEPALQAMQVHGLVFDALVLPQHLPRILTFAQRHPGLSIVIDHAAKPAIASGQWQPWADGIAQIAAQTTAVCKMSGVLTEAGPHPDANAARRWCQHVLDCFGAQRVLWGSDWPVLELASVYTDWWQEARQLMQPYTEAERSAVFGGNARRVYRLD